MIEETAGLVNTVNSHYGVLLTVATTFFFYLLNLRLKYGGVAPVVASKSYQETWVWSSYIISLIHASVVGFSSLLCVLIDRDLLVEVNHYFEPSYWVICFSTGYFIYDLLDEIAHSKLVSTTQYIVHHVLVLTILIPAVVSQRFIGISTTGLITEFHNVFLHSRIILGFYGGEKRPRLKNTLGVANLVSCFTCRLILFPWIAYTVSYSTTLSTPILVLLYGELVYIFLYSLYIFVLSVKTDFPNKLC
jgi:hypothetical protein